MENEQWTAKYQQSVPTLPTGLERTENNLNNGNTEHLSDSKTLISTGKDEPENDAKYPETNLECNPPTVTISEKSKQTIQAILDHIKSLSRIEKFLLFLKLPSEVSHAVDPFRQPLNPLGSRSEIYRTISWIKTHLEEDPDISLPKQEVYNGYYNYCEKNSVKPLSQADFGKVMKQVYPRVRARRLGTRGNSRYCYSGLRRCIKLKSPILPDLADKPSSTEAPFTQSNLSSAAWLIVKEWSEQQLGTQFSSLQALAYYLILNHSIGTGTDAATKITNAAESSLKSDDTNGKNGNKHREMQLQLQRKIQQNKEGKERKRKLQSPKSEQKPSAKKSRSQSVPAPSVVPVASPTVQLATTSSGECSTASSSSTSPTQGKPICDKSLDFTQVPVLPDFNSFQKPSADGLLGNSGQETNVGATTNKVAIPRLQSTPIHLTTPPKKQQKPAKYKSIQPRLQQCDIAPYNPQSLSQATEDNRSQDLHNIDSIKDRKICDDECDVPDFPLTRERLNSVSNVEKDAMDEYLGTNNSQHEEELSKYFSNNNVSDTPESENTSKLSTLRQLLEQNGIPESKSSIHNVLDNTVIPDKVLFQNTNQSQTTTQSDITYITPISHQGNLPSTSNHTKRHVSFETPAAEDAVPPSPNTRRKNFSFTPISPGPQSPNGMQSKCSSTNASPFVSPRSTPILRTKTNPHQTAGIMKNDTRKPLKIKKEIDLSLEIPNEIQFPGSNYVPMSAPVSPMLNNKSVLQKLLNSNSKVAYIPGYASSSNVPALQPDTSHEVSQLFASNIDSCRSQSVPLNQMVVKTFPIDPSFIAGQDVTPSEFSEIDPIPESESDNVKRILHSLDEQTCDNNNIDIFNIDLTNNPCLPAFGIHMINNNLEINGFSQNNLPFNNIPAELPMARNMRSQSMDINMTVESKCNPSRSVPNTPLSFMQNVKPQIKSTYGQSSRSYPSTPLNSDETFTYNINGDCLLNGQPIRSDGITEEIEFMQNYNINGDNNIEQLPHSKNFIEGPEFSIVENDPSLMDENGVLLEQNYSGNIN